MKKTSTSIIISAYNEEKVIGACLESLAKQTLKPKEIVLVDDGSMDNTLKEVLVATSSSASVQSLRNDILILREQHKGAGAARNTGAARATGDILVFIDADMQFHQSFLQELTDPIREGKTKGTFSKQEFISNWDNCWARFWNYWKGLYEPIAVPKNFPDHSPVFRAILRSEFQKIGGFDETRGYNDDWSLSEGLGYEATETGARFYHQNPASLLEAFSQARWTAKRTYRCGWLGFLFALFRSFPIWAASLRWLDLWKRRRYLADSTLQLLFSSFLFFFVVQTGETIGIMEFSITRNPKK